MSEVIYTGQGIAKDCIVGDRMMNRYGIFNGLERPRRIGRKLDVSILGFDVPAITSVTSVVAAGGLTNTRWYAYRAVYASSIFTRPVAVADGSVSYTRGNGSAIDSAQAVFAASSMDVVVPGSADAGVTYILLYRSTGKTTQALAEAGPFYYVAQGANAAGAVTINDGTADAAVGIELETDNNYPNAWRYAVCSHNRLFAGGNYVLGALHTCTVTPGSSTVTVSSPILYDGIMEWFFECIDDESGGVDGGGMYYANYASATTLELVDADGASTNYNGDLAGAGHSFTLYLAGYQLRWSKTGEPESWPTINLINFDGDITGIAEIPNLPMLMVCTDKPSMWALDLSLVGTMSFKTNRRLVSTEYSATSHYGLVGVDRRLRGIDAHRGCIFETDGVSVIDITQGTVPRIWEYLDKTESKIKNWHCAYDKRAHLFGAFVGFRYPQRLVDFCIGQNTLTQGWFFNFEKDLLCTGNYVDPQTGEAMVLGGTEGLGDTGAVWGRIWCPNKYDDWIPSTSLRSGNLTAGTVTTITVDNSAGMDLYTGAQGLAGRWVLVCDANGEHSQLAYIQSNTVDVITIDSVLNGVNATQFVPVPEAGWKFYLGLIEMRWGPKRFDFEDPDIDKKILEVQVTMSDYNESDLPFIRLYRGLEKGYTYQNALIESTYRDGDKNQNLYSRYKTHIEPTPRWGVAVIDRSYDKTALRNLTIVFHKVEEK